MVAVGLSETAVAPYLARIFASHGVAVGCVNSPTNITVSGKEDAITALKQVLDQEHIFARQLPVGVAYHSVQMEEVAGEYLALVQALDPPNSLPFAGEAPLMYSSVTGQVVSAGQLRNGEYWVANMCSRIRFSDALTKLCMTKNDHDSLDSVNSSSEVSHLVEIGPHSALQRPIKKTVSHVGYSTALKLGVSGAETILHLVGELKCLGYMVNLLAANRITKDTDAQMLVHLPAYPFNHSQAYWSEGRNSRNIRFRKYPHHELLGTSSADWNSLEAKWSNLISYSESPWIRDHKYNDLELYPAAGMIVMAIEATRQLLASITTRRIKGYRFLDVTLVRALRLTMTAEGVETQFYMRPNKLQGLGSSGRSKFWLYTMSNKEWVKNCRGTVITEFEDDTLVDSSFLEAEGWRVRYKEAFARGKKNCKFRVNSKQMYDSLNAFGFGFGPNFQTLDEVSYSEDGDATATISLGAWKNKVPAETRETQRHVIHPTDLDGWKADLDLLESDQIAVHCNSVVNPTQLNLEELIDDSELTCLYFMGEALTATSQMNDESLPPHLDYYKKWMRYYYHAQDAQALLATPQGRKFMDDTQFREARIKRFELSGSEGIVYTAVGRNLVRILRGEVDALELLLEGHMVQDFYSSSSFAANYQRISAFVELSVHKNPNQSILEIGAGTGGATGPILDVLGPENHADAHGTPKYDQYTYTDISPSFFQGAKERFSRH
ncbi:MAG: hypothetical protein Q9225_001880 [Loekoesia sp. 1 TL-2023]